MAEPLRIIIIHEAKGFGAGCLDMLDFTLLGDTVEEIEAKLPAALEAFCGQPVQYRVVSKPKAK